MTRCHYCSEPMRPQERRAVVTLWRAPMPMTVQRAFHVECVARYEVMPGALTVAAVIVYSLHPPGLAYWRADDAAEAQA